MSSKSIATVEQGLLPLSLSGHAVPAMRVRDKLPFDATRLSEALKYQVHVAIDYCHTLKPDDVLWIEVLGDVTVEGQEQVEVKDYSDDLTDNHENLWKTLRNWLNTEFRHENYVSLVLLTTQKFGGLASIKNWSNWDGKQRLAALDEIHQDAEKRHAERSAAQKADDADAAEADPGKGKQTRVPESLKLQRRVMATEARGALEQVLAKVKIITDEPKLAELIERYKRGYLRAVLPHRQDEFLDDLFGFMTNATRMTTKWRFTSAEFTSKFAELTKRYMIGTVKFPRIDAKKLGLAAQEAIVQERLYVRKLDEIGAGQAVIGQATIDLLCAETYIIELFKDGTTTPEDVEQYSGDHLRLHCSSRLAQMGRSAPGLSHDERQKASCTFYHERCAQSVAGFGSYDFTPLAFRNGVYHLLADQDAVGSAEDFQWRLWE